jgi:hypothetical protein
MANLAAVLSQPMTMKLPEEDQPPEEWRGQHQGFSKEGYEYCPILPWYNEVVTRMHEASAAGSHVVNLSYTHPRGYIPTKILNRRDIRKVLTGWVVDNAATAPTPAPDHWFLPRGSKDLEYCDLDPFLKEIERREREAVAEALTLSRHDGQRHVPLSDLTTFHPRGGIPPAITKRLDRRRNRTWRQDMTAEIERLTGEANKAEAFAKTQLERAQAFKDQERDPTALQAGAKELMERAEQFRENVKWLKKELGDASRDP